MNVSQRRFGSGVGIASSYRGAGETRRECRPGDYPCDIVTHLLGDENHVVVIENQFGKNNHDHLGKFLIYASVHKAMTGIWITEQASEPPGRETT